MKVYSISCYNNLQMAQKKSVKNNKLNLSFEKSTLPGCNFAYNKISFLGNSYLDESISGYDKQKKSIKSVLVEPVKNLNGPFPPIFLLYSPDKDVSKIFEYSIQKDLSDNCTFVDLNSKIQNPDDFLPVLETQLMNSRENYLNSSKVSIIFIDNIEKYINTSIKQLEGLKRFYSDAYDENDFSVIKAYGFNGKNAGVLKHLTDFSSLLPNRSNDKNNAAVIFSATSNPQLIDPELLRRNEKLYSVVIPPMAKDTIETELKKEVSKQKVFLNSLNNANITEINELDLPYRSWQRLKKEKLTYHRTSFDIDLSKIPFETIASFLVPNGRLGAYTHKQIPEIVEEAAMNYIAEPEKGFLHSLLKSFNQAEREISPEYLKKITAIQKLLEYKKNDEIQSVQDIADSFEGYSLGFVNESEIEQKVEEVVNLEFDAIKLKYKASMQKLSLEERQRLRLGEEILAAKSIQQNDIYNDFKSAYIKSRVNLLGGDSGKFFYGDGKNESVNLYLGSFGYDKSTLWIDNANYLKVYMSLKYIDFIKMNEVFKSVKVIEFATDKNSFIHNSQDTGRKTIDGQNIYRIILPSKSM